MSTQKKTAKEFIPPFCAHPNCKDHRHYDPTWEYKKDSTFITPGKPGRHQRYTCKRCNGSFSIRSFAYFTDSPVRRSGKMTEAQKKRREELEKALGTPDPKAVAKDILSLLQTVLGDQVAAIMHSDGHKAFLWAIKQLKCSVRHLVTSSKDHRSKDNDLWEINLLDMVIRHGSANHKRETIAWSKRRQKMVERMVIFLVSRNYMNGRRVKEGPRSPTPTMARGMTDHWITPDELFEKRLFRDQVELSERWAEYYDGLIKTVALDVNKAHTLKYAY